MKKFLVGLLAFGLMSAHAAQFNCKVVDGDFDNSSLKLSSVSLESESPYMTLADAVSLNINISGLIKRFRTTMLTVGKRSKMDFELESNEAVKATLLINKSAGQVNRRGKFNALLVISGDAAFSSYKSLVYNLKCRL